MCVTYRRFDIASSENLRRTDSGLRYSDRLAAWMPSGAILK